MKWEALMLMWRHSYDRIPKHVAKSFSISQRLCTPCKIFLFAVVLYYITGPITIIINSQNSDNGKIASVQMQQAWNLWVNKWQESVKNGQYWIKNNKIPNRTASILKLLRWTPQTSFQDWLLIICKIYFLQACKSPQTYTIILLCLICYIIRPIDIDAFCCAQLR